MWIALHIWRGANVAFAEARDKDSTAERHTQDDVRHELTHVRYVCVFEEKYVRLLFYSHVYLEYP